MEAFVQAVAEDSPAMAVLRSDLGRISAHVGPPPPPPSPPAEDSRPVAAVGAAVGLGLEYRTVAELEAEAAVLHGLIIKAQAAVI